MPSTVNTLYEFGEYRLDPQKRILRRGEEIVPLTPKAFDVLLVLVESDGRVVSKDELMKAVWSDSFVEESNLTQTVFMLRKALGETTEQPYVLTIPGRGYRFAAEVKQSAKTGHPTVELPSRFARNDADVPPKTGIRRRKWPLFVRAAVILIAALLGAYFRWFHPGSRASAPSTRVMLAVLPFQNFTGDPGQEYFSDGMTEEMITQLGSVNPEHLGVIARTSVMRYKHSQDRLAQIGRELGVQYVLEGSVRRDSDKVRITAQLIQLRDQTHLWARQYDREQRGLLAVQGEIAHDISNEIRSALGENKTSNPTSQAALSPQAYEAYDLYLKGQYFWNKRTVDAFQQAIKYFEQAIAKDPNNARAQAGLADCYALIGGYTGVPRPEYPRNALAAARRALEIDPNLPEAHTAFALIVLGSLDWQTAEKEYQRAIELNPNYSTAHHWYAEYLMWRGRFDEALRESERARQLDPLSLIIAADNGAILYYSRQYDRAIERFRYVLDIEPHFPRAEFLIIFAYLQKGMFAEALPHIKNLSAENPLYWSNLAYVYGRSGQGVQALQALDRLQQLNLQQPVDSWTMFEAYIGVDDTEQALTWLEKAYSQQPNPLTGLRVDPFCDPLRSDPRFQDLLRRVGLAQ